MRVLPLFVLLALIANACAITVSPNLHLYNKIGSELVSVDIADKDLASIALTDVPVNSPFNSFNVKQCVTGSGIFNIILKGVGRVGGVSVPDPSLGLPGPSFASDPLNQRFVFSNPGTQQFTLSNGTYTTGPNPVTGEMMCYYDPDYTFAHEVYEHTTLIKLSSGLLGLTDRYFGRALDVGSCHSGTAFDITTGPFGAMRILEFSQVYPTPIEGPSQGLTATGILTLTSNCPTSGAAFDNMFQLPSYCSGELPSWCDSHRFD